MKVYVLSSDHSYTYVASAIPGISLICRFQYEFFWSVSADKTSCPFLARWSVHSQLLPVPIGNQRCTDTTDCQPTHMPGPCAAAHMVTWLTIHHVCNVQERNRSGEQQFSCMCNGKDTQVQGISPLHRKGYLHVQWKLEDSIVFCYFFTLYMQSTVHVYV